MQPRGEMIVRPCLSGGTMEAVNGFFYPLGWMRRMWSDDPSLKDAGGATADSCEARFGIDKNWSGGDPTIQRYGSVRFGSPRGDDLDTAGGLGYWCMRSSRYVVILSSYLVRDDVYFGETGVTPAGMTIEAWLVDQYWDQSQIDWNNRAMIAESGYKISAYLSAPLRVFDSGLMHTQRVLVELPDLADGSGPPKIYGYAVRVECDPQNYAGDTLNHSGRCIMSVQAYQENDRRGTDEETGIRIPTTLAPRWSPVGGFIPGDPAGGGYVGEWEDGAYVPEEPYTCGKDFLTYLDMPHIDSNDKVTRATCPKDGSTVVNLVAVDGDAPNNGLVYWITEGPYHGALSGLYPGITYTPTAGYVGGDYFRFRVSDMDGNYSNISTVSITVA